MSTLKTFRGSRRMHTKRRGGAGDDECDICFQQVTTFKKLNCKGYSEQGSNICKPYANIIKTLGRNSPCVVAK